MRSTLAERPVVPASSIACRGRLLPRTLGITCTLSGACRSSRSPTQGVRDSRFRGGCPPHQESVPARGGEVGSGAPTRSKSARSVVPVFGCQSLLALDSIDRVRQHRHDSLKRFLRSFRAARQVHDERLSPYSA